MKKDLFCGLVWAAAALPAWAPWSAPETISPAAGEWQTCYNFATAVVADANGNFHAVFFEKEGAAAYYRRYDRAAGRWEPAQRVDESGGRDAAIAVDAFGGLHLFFKSGDAICHRVGDATGRWGPPEYLSLPDWRLAYPSPLALPSGDVALAAVAERASRRPAYIWFTIWRRDAATFDPLVRLSETTGADGSWMPTTAYFQNELRVVWRDDSSGEFELYERTCDGSSWTPTRRLTYDPAPTFHPRLVVDGDGSLRLLFMDKRGGRPAIWEMADDGGGWGPARVLYDGGGEAYHPNVVSAPTGQSLAFWEDNRDGGRYGIYFGALFGGAWSRAGRVSRTADADATLASAAVANGADVAVVYTEGKGKVCVRRLPLSEAPVAGVTFVVRPAPGAVKLWWGGECVGRFSYFDLYRKSAAEASWRRVNAEPIAGRPPFTYRDEPASPGYYAYKLEGRTRTGYALTLGTARAAAGDARGFISALKVYPNPCRGTLRVAWRQEGPAAAAVAVYDITGRRVASARADAVAGPNVLLLETENLPPGYYVAAVAAGGGETTASFIVTR